MRVFPMQNLRTSPLAFFLMTTFIILLSGCKIEIRVPQGGTVVSSDGAYRCEAGQTCVIDVVDLFFDETFIAQPAPGYYFSRWNEEESSLCGGETTPCRLFTGDFEGNPALQSFLESEETWFLEPNFIWSPVCPEPTLVVSPAVPTD